MHAHINYNVEGACIYRLRQLSFREEKRRRGADVRLPALIAKLVIYVKRALAVKFTCVVEAVDEDQKTYCSHRTIPSSSLRCVRVF